MSLRLLLGMLASALPDQHYSEITKVPEEGLPEEWKYVSVTQPKDGEVYENIVIFIQDPAKFHIGMLTISLITGLAYGGYVAYTCWKEKEPLLGYIRNLLIALVCRTFFTILFDGVVLLGNPHSPGGGNTLLSFEKICLDLVYGFWLSLTVYAHARVQRNFKSEPTLRLYQYGIPGVAVFFAFIWIFTMQDFFPQLSWWPIWAPMLQRLANSANLLFLLIQLGLVGDMCRMIMATKSSLDNDSVSLLWRVAAMMGALILIFWLHLGLSLGPYRMTQSYLYFYFFIDGIEGTLVCACLFLFYRWVTPFTNKYCPINGPGETVTPKERLWEEEVLPGGRGIVTVDSVCVSHESGRWKTSTEEDYKDVVYSNVVEPHRLQKTLELYKRLNVIPFGESGHVTVVEGEQFYDCQIPVEEINCRPSQVPVPKEDNFGLKNEKITETTQKKNAFYASKYLILDSKESEIPKYLETRPSVSSVSEKDSQKEEQKDDFASLEAGDLVRKWLMDNSENMPKNEKTPMVEQKELNRENSDSVPKHVPDVISEKVHKDKSLIPDPEKTKNHPEPIERPTEDVEDKDFPDNQKQVDLNTENVISVPRKMETPTENINKTEDGANEAAPGPPPDASKVAPKHEVPSESVADGQAPAKMDVHETKDKPEKSPSPFLTYSELLAFRSQRDKTEEPPVARHSLSESIFSTLDSLINATLNSQLLNSLAGFTEEEHEDFTTDDRLPDQVQLVRQSGKVSPRDEPKPHSDETFSPLADEPMAEQPADDEIRLETFSKTLKNELGHYSLENEIETPDDQQEFFIQDTDIPQPGKVTEESLETSSSEFSAEKRQSFSSDRSSKPSRRLITVDASETQSQETETSDSEFTIERQSSSSRQSFSLDKYYTNILTARANFDNQQNLLQSKNK